MAANCKDEKFNIYEFANFRWGKNAKFLLTGDPGQIDLPRRVISGLKEALLILKDIKGVGMVFLDDKDVIRHKLVKQVIEAYKNIENRE